MILCPKSVLVQISAAQFSDTYCTLKDAFMTNLEVDPASVHPSFWQRQPWGSKFCRFFPLFLAFSIERCLFRCVDRWTTEHDSTAHDAAPFDAFYSWPWTPEKTRKVGICKTGQTKGLRVIHGNSGWQKSEHPKTEKCQNPNWHQFRFQPKAGPFLKFF